MVESKRKSFHTLAAAAAGASLCVESRRASEALGASMGTGIAGICSRRSLATTWSRWSRVPLQETQQQPLIPHSLCPAHGEVRQHSKRQ